MDLYKLFVTLCLVASVTSCGGKKQSQASVQSIAKPISISEFVEQANSDARFAKAAEYLATHDVDTLAVGRYEIDGDNTYLLVVEGEMKTPEQAKLEAHDLYFDVQMPLCADETFALALREECVQPCGEMNVEKDIIFYDDASAIVQTVRPHQLLILAPQVAHAPMIGVGHQRKAIFKVKCNQPE